MNRLTNPEIDALMAQAMPHTKPSASYYGLARLVEDKVHAELEEVARARDQLRNELDMHRMESNRQNIIAGRVVARLKDQADGLARTLRAVRMMIDGTQPKDLAGAVMAINAAMPPQDPGQLAGECGQVHPDSALPSYRPGEHPEAAA